jgi:hypothetical protein
MINAVKRFWRWLRGLADFEFESVDQLNAESVERFITRVERLHLEPGDGIVVTTTCSLSAAHVANLKQYLEAYLETVTEQKHPVFVMEDGMGIKIVSGPRPPPGRLIRENSDRPAQPPPLPKTLP